MNSAVSKVVAPTNFYLLKYLRFQRAESPSKRSLSQKGIILPHNTQGRAVYLLTQWQHGAPRLLPSICPALPASLCCLLLLDCFLSWPPVASSSFKHHIQRNHSETEKRTSLSRPFLVSEHALSKGSAADFLSVFTSTEPHAYKSASPQGKQDRPIFLDQ